MPFLVESILSPGTKQASDSLAQTRGIMDAIYKENPSFWPHGIAPEMCDGGCWLVREASSQAPVGFAGWQERDEGFKKIGYYAIGILPEWRHQGLARQAVRQVIATKAAGVDEVKAYIVPGNAPSIALADSLGVPVVKMAMTALKQVGKWLAESPKVITTGKVLGGSALNAGFWDQIYNSAKEHPAAWNEWDGDRIRLGLTNAAFGGYGGLGGSAKRMFGAVAASPIKDVAMRAAAGVPDFLHNQGAQAAATQALATATGKGNLSNGTLGALGVGAGALGLAGLLSHLRQSGAVQEIADASDKGRVRVKLPTNKPGDQETEIDMPFEQMDISNALRGAIARDTKRRLRSESASRVMHRGTPASAAQMPDVYPAQTSTLTA